MEMKRRHLQTEEVYNQSSYSQPVGEPSVAACEKLAVG